ncbi:hypothetical protein TSMEX_008428 [Taenia solium]|eukprot:TsM_001104700 transcript=TsM_001104700 gene=TsM_001104700
MAMAESRSDFKLINACTEMFHSHFADNFATSYISVECLRKASSKLGEVFDPDHCRSLYKSLQIQRLDHRLNLGFIFNCGANNNWPFECGNGVVRCLQHQHVPTNTKQNKESLTHSRSRYVCELLISANLNHRVDSTLAVMRRSVLVKHCSEGLVLPYLDSRNDDDMMLECLR